jgi:ferredoxin
MSLPVSTLLESGAITHSECMQCGACCDTCRKGALTLEFGKLPSELESSARRLNRA